MPKGAYDRSGNTVWSAELIGALRLLWVQKPQLSTIEIGRRLGQSKNSVVGKAHRLDLPARPSPIHDRWPTTKAPERRGVPKPLGPTLPALKSAAVIAIPLPALRTKNPKPVAAPLYGRVTQCCFPIGEPGTKAFRYCDLPTLPAAVYCEEHHRRSYVKAHRADPAAPDPHATPSRFSFQRHGGE